LHDGSPDRNLEEYKNNDGQCGLCPVQPSEFSAILKDHDAKPVQLFVVGNDQEKGNRRDNSHKGGKPSFILHQPKRNKKTARKIEEARKPGRPYP